VIDHRENPHTKLTVTYNGEEITTFTVTKFIIWNRGTEPVRDRDVVKSTPLKLKLSEGRLLEASVVKVSSVSNGFSITKADNTALDIHFDYIDPNEGMVVEVRHTAPTGEAIDVIGKVVGVPKIARRLEIDPLVIMQLVPKVLRPSGSRRMVRWAMLVAIITVVTVAAAACRDLIYAGVEARQLGISIAVSTGIILTLFSWMLYKLFRPSIPEALADTYFEREPQPISEPLLF